MKITVTNSIEILRPPEEVAAILLDAEKAVFWTSDLERFEVLEKPAGLVGSRARLHYKQGDRRYVMEDVLLELEPNRRFLSKITGDAIEAEVETNLTPINGGTLVNVKWKGSGRPFLLRLILPLMRRSIARQAQGDLMKLKELVESS